MLTAVLAAGLWIWLQIRPYESTELSDTSWATGGKPLTVVIHVTDAAGRPVPSAPVYVDNSSGGKDGVTDRNGVATLEMGETDVRGITVSGIHVMNRDRFLARLLEFPSAGDGLQVSVRLRKR